MKRTLAIAWLVFCLVAIGLRLWIGRDIGYLFHELMMILGFPLAPLLWKLTTYALLALAHSLGGSAELPSDILGHGVTWVGFPLVVYLQWFVIVPWFVRWGMARYRRRTNAT